MKLSFDKPVQIIFKGKAGNNVGWTRGTVFQKIENICENKDNPKLEEDGDCKIDIGDDLIVWTRHFTTFTTYTEEMNSGEVIGGYIGGVISNSNTENKKEIEKEDIKKEDTLKKIVLVNKENTINRVEEEEISKEELEQIPDMKDSFNKNLLTASAGYIGTSNKAIISLIILFGLLIGVIVFVVVKNKKK